MFDYERLRSLIRDAMGADTQKEFAAKCGLSVPHLNRLMNEPSPSRPYKSTLKKLASYTSASYEELLVMCGYESTPAETRKQKSPLERAELNAADMAQGFAEMTKGIRPYASIRDFFEEHIMLYSSENISVQYTAPKECPDTRAEYYVPCVYEFSTDDYKCTTWFVLYYYKTHSGKLFITEVGMKLEDMIYAGMTELVDMVKTSEDAQTYTPYVYRITYRKTYEERLLKAIFRDDDEAYITSIVGFGFPYPRTPNAFDSFIEAHRETLQYIPQRATVDKTQTYQTGMLIAGIMREETGLQYEYYENEDRTAPGCIMIRSDYEIDEVKPVTRRYAKELGIPKYGECIVMTIGFKRKDMVFTVDEKEEA